jgi:CubicO group peptidase (beta-lactamase class C family)
MTLTPEMATRRSFDDLKTFTGVPQSENFANIKNLLPVREMPAPADARVWEQGDPVTLPATFEHEGRTISSEQYLADSETSALLVLQDGRVRYENYWGVGGAHVQWLSMSVAKSWVSALVGIAVADGAIRSIEDPISDYIRVEAGSAYDGVAIADVLRMSSGARWDEDYSNLDSDAVRLAHATTLPDGSLDHFVATMSREFEPGTLCRYNSADTQALGWLLIEATGEDLAGYMQRKLVAPLGFEQPAYWILDGQGRELTFAGVNMTARDFARLGELYRNGGVWGGEQLVPRSWVDQSLSVHSPAQAPGAVQIGDEVLPVGYGQQWWLYPDGVFQAQGVYNQTVHVDPARKVTVVKLSATRKYGNVDDEISPLDPAFITAVARSVD